MKQLPACPIASAIVLVGDKWKIQIMRELLLHQERGQHYGQLKRAIPHISDKMLSKSLQALTEDEIITKTVLATTPPQTNYRLTEIGAQLGDVLLALKEWGNQYKALKGMENESRPD